MPGNNTEQKSTDLQEQAIRSQEKKILHLPLEILDINKIVRDDLSIVSAISKE